MLFRAMFGMNSDRTPPAELYVVARALTPYFRARIDEPEWTLAVGARDWRRFVSPSLRNVWSRLSEETRLAVYINAEQTRQAYAKKQNRPSRRATDDRYADR